MNFYLPDPKWATLPIGFLAIRERRSGAELLWTAPNGPATILFDSSSGATRYQIYFGSNWPALPVPDAKAGVRLEAREGDGRTIITCPTCFSAWKQSTKVLGREILDGINVGGNRFGPQGNLLMHFQGWTNATAPEHLQLAVISTDAAFVLVDGKEGRRVAGPPRF